MRLNLNWQKNLYYALVVILIIINASCRNRNAVWRDVLTKQINHADHLNPLDSALYNFMVDYRIPALSAAVTKDGKTVYSKTFGLADLSDGKEANNESLFRIAGTSTAITSLAIRKLVMMGQISYDSKLFGKGGILGTQYGHKPYGPLLTEITVADLLNHTCGGWSGADDVIADHDLRALFNSKDSALSWILDQTPLKDHPGKIFNFSFTGFFILGMVIEKVTGKPYEEWVKENILLPSGITDMQVEKGSSQNINEVSYYKDLSWPLYNGEIDENLYLSRADAALGWIASAGDLVKLMLKVKNLDSLNSGMRSKSPLTILNTPKTRPGWVPDWSTVDISDNWWEQFDFYGTTSILVRSSKGFCWAILINTYRPAIAEYFPDIDTVITKTMDNSSIRWSREQEP